MKIIRLFTILLLLAGLGHLGHTVVAPTSTTGSTGAAVVSPMSIEKPSAGLRWMIALNGIFPSGGSSVFEEAYFGEIRLFAAGAPYINNNEWTECAGQLLPIAQNQALFALLGTTFGGNGTTNFALPDLRGRTPIGAGQGPGLPSYQVGQTGGSNTLTLNASNLPSHSHTISGGSTDATGSGVAVDNMPPYLALYPFIVDGGPYYDMGTIRWTAFSFAASVPGLRCEGQLVPVAQNSALFTILGTTYGGNGTSNFGIPDLRGRMMVGAGTGPGLNAVALGERGGQVQRTIGVAELPAHTHTYSGGTTGSTGSGSAAAGRAPYLGLTTGVALSGLFGDSSDIPAIAEVRFHAGTAQFFSFDRNSTYWPCDGSSHAITLADTLFEFYGVVVGSTWGGDGSTTVGVPDLRGRSPFGIGTGPGLGPIVLAALSGSDMIAGMTPAMMPAHTHTYIGAPADAEAPNISGSFSPQSIVAGTPLPDYVVQAVTSDNVGVVSVTQVPAPGTPTSVGSVSVSITARDAANNTATTSFSVTVTPADPVTTLLASKGGAVPNAGTDARIQGGALWTTFGVPSVNGAGQVAFLASWKAPAAGVVPAQSGTGIFVNNALVVKKGAPVPGIAGAVFSAFKEPLLGPDGSVAFVATLANAPATTGAVLPTSNVAIFLDADGAGPNAAVLIARKGGIATGTTVWSAFTSVSLGVNAVAFTGTLVSKTAGVSPGPGGATTLSDSGLWVYDRTTSTMALALREGDALLGSTVKIIGALAAHAGSAGQGRGLANDGTQDYTVVRVTLGDNRQTVGYIGQDATGAFTRTAGGDAEDYGAGAKWLSFGLPTQNTVSTAMAFLGTVKAGTGSATSANNVAIFAEDDVDYIAARIVAKGDVSPGCAGIFSAFKDPVNASNRGVAFLGTMKTVPGITAANNDGVWHSDDTHGLTLVAREGSLAAEAGGGVWKAFTSLALPEGRGPLFVASMHSKIGTTSPGPGGITTANDVGLWARDSFGNPRLLLQEGDAIGASTVKTFVVLSSVTGSPAQTRSFNNGGSVVVKATDMLGAQHLLHIAVP